MGPEDSVDLLLRGVAIGAQGALCLALMRDAPNRQLRLAALLFLASNIAFLLGGIALVQRAPPPVPMLLWLLQVGGAGWFWLFVRALFEDERLGAPTLSVPLALSALGVAAEAAPPFAAHHLWDLHNVAGLVLALHALLVIQRSWRGDLVEARRRLRGPMLGAIALFSVAISAAQLGQAAGFDAPWYGLAFSGLQAALGLGAAAAFLAPRETLFESSQPAPTPVADSDAPWIARLEAVMEGERLWAREGLTIADVAAAVGVPEYRLRRLVNDGLGHRNFPAFVNRYRIAAAKSLLGDPAESGRTIASIAYDTGFGSLGPFNRAFRDATGSSPTQWRRAALQKSLAESR